MEELAWRPPLWTSLSLNYLCLPRVGLMNHQCFQNLHLFQQEIRKIGLFGIRTLNLQDFVMQNIHQFSFKVNQDTWQNLDSQSKQMMRDHYTLQLIVITYKSNVKIKIISSLCPDTVGFKGFGIDKWQKQQQRLPIWVTVSNVMPFSENGKVL